jgi:hypothetical protein
MKFILCEDKFLLNENPGFILEERFILDEEVLLEAQATLKQLVIDLNKLDTMLPSLLEVLPVGTELKILDGTIIEDEKLVIEEKIKTSCTEIQNLLSGKKNFKELIDKIRAKAGQPEGETFSEEEVKVLQPLCYSIASDGISVKDRLKGIKSHKGELAEQVATLQERAPRLKTNIEELYKLFETDTPEEPPEEDPEEPEEPIKYSLDPEKLELKVGETSNIKLMAAPKPESPVKATFASTDDKIVTVTETGDVTAIAAGEAQIKVTVADQTLECAVVVAAKEEEKPEIKYSLKDTKVDLTVGQTFDLKILAEPKPEGAIKAAFKSATPTVAAVSEVGTITGMAKGTSTITVEVEGQTLTCEVTVAAAKVSGWEELYDECTKSINRPEAYEAFWKGGLPKEGEANPKNLPVASEDKFAKGYFKGEWGANAERIMSLGTNFINCLHDIGWTEKQNPFLALLKHLCTFDTVLINDSAFTQLRSLYETKISSEDLRGKGLFGEVNLVRNPLFYKNSGGNIASYLNWRSVLQKSGKLPKDSNEKVVYANIAATGGNTENLQDTDRYQRISEAKFMYEVRPLAQYKKLIKEGFGVNGDKRKTVPATDKDIEAIVAKAKSPEDAKKLLTYLVNLYRVLELSTLKNLFKADTIGNKLKANRNTVSTKYEDDLNFDLLVNTAAKKYSFDQLKDLCTKLIEIAKI